MTGETLYPDEVLREYAFRVAADSTLPDFAAGPGDTILIRNEPVPDEFVAKTSAEVQLLGLRGLANEVGEERVRQMLRENRDPLAEADFIGPPLPWMTRGEAEAFAELGVGEIVELPSTS